MEQLATAETTEPASDLLAQAIDAHEQGQTLAARGLLERLVRQAPEDAEVRLWAGILAFEANDYLEAIDHFRQALTTDPRLAIAHYNLGLCLEALRDSKGAIEAYSRAIDCQPDHVHAYNNLCILHAASGHLELARHDYEQAIRLAPDYADGYFNRGVLNTDQDRLTEAEQDYRQAIALEPEHESAQFALGVCWLALGQWQQGWPQYEWRWRYATVNRSRPPRIAPPWDEHSSLQGKRLLLDYEQGYGDCLQFCRFVPTLAALGAEIQLRIQPALRPLLGSLSDVQRLLCDEPPPPLRLPVESDELASTAGHHAREYTRQPGLPERTARADRSLAESPERAQSASAAGWLGLGRKSQPQQRSAAQPTAGTTAGRSSVWIFLYLSATRTSTGRFKAATGAPRDPLSG